MVSIVLFDQFGDVEVPGLNFEIWKGDKSAIMLVGVHMTRKSCAINTETERRIQATQVTVNVTKKIRSSIF